MTRTIRAHRNNKGHYCINDVVNWFLSKGHMSPKKLQKLLYYAYSWTLTLLNEDKDNLDSKLFDNGKFEAWVHGPVVPEIYHEYKIWGYNDISKRDVTIVFDEDVEDVLNQVWEVYGDFNGNELESLTHQEAPWKNARKGYKPLDRCNEEITDEDIYECYIQRIED